MFSDQFIAQVSKMFRDIESSQGTRELCFLVWKSFMQAIDQYKGNKAQLVNEIRKVVFLSKNTSPRISMLIFMFSKFLEDFFEVYEETDTLPETKKKMLGACQYVLAKRKRSVQKLLERNTDIIKEGDTILLHMYSGTIMNLLETVQKQGIDFDVIVAEQERKKTALIIRKLKNMSIDFQVIPEYLISHLEDNISLFLTGVVTINSHYHIIADAGSHSLISELFYHKIPIYACMTTDKMSLWKAKEHHHSFKSKTAKTKHGVKYEKLVFSHDRYPISMITTFLTNKGALTPLEVKALYDRYFTEQEQWRNAHDM
jgi:translation initiation factor 2B subunit (eIF-2B alpha/beta/delta family)